MKPHFIQLGSQEIAYFESTRTAASSNSPAVLLIHGNSISSRSFLRQLKSPLGERCRLIAMDLPGHGMSQPAADPETAYSFPALAETIAALTERLEIRDAVMVGFSLGGNLLLEALDRLTAARGIMVLGCFPVSLPLDIQRIAFPHPILASLFKADLTDEDVNLWVAGLLRPGATPPAFLATDIRQTDKRFRTVLGAAIARGNLKDQNSAVAKLRTPLAVLLGAEDQILRESYLRSLHMPSLWQDALQIIPGAGHLAHWEQAERFNSVLESFVRDVV